LGSQKLGLESLVRFTEKLRVEFVFEVLFGLDFPHQPATLIATKQRHPEKAGTIVRASREFLAIDGFVCGLWWF